VDEPIFFLVLARPAPLDSLFPPDSQLLIQFWPAYGCALSVVILGPPRPSGPLREHWEKFSPFEILIFPVLFLQVSFGPSTSGRAHPGSY